MNWYYKTQYRKYVLVTTADCIKQEHKDKSN